jgi:hypothetical protein
VRSKASLVADAIFSRLPGFVLNALSRVPSETSQVLANHHRLVGELSDRVFDLGSKIDPDEEENTILLNLSTFFDFIWILADATI